SIVFACLPYVCFLSRRTSLLLSAFFFFHDTPTTEFYSLSLHDALPILMGAAARIRAVLAPSAIDPAGLHRLTPVAPALLDASADRPQTGDVPEPIYDDALARVYRGDCARLVEAVGQLGVNLVVTSPPYSLGGD